MEDAPLVAIGEVLRPYGLRGEVKVRPLTDRPRERFEGLERCTLWEPDQDRREPCRIASSRFDGETAFIRMEGVDSPEEARRFQGRLLAVGRNEVLPLGEGQFYPWQLEGAVVQTRDGRPVGHFVRVESGAQDLWVVDDGTRQRLIPAVAEIVVEVSVADRRIVIDPPEGLLEL
ncbi:MAG TPA: ribosome maturation factor RimM [Candidatus Dormibacteraeota bacterium]|jgi:16S rRNA processing protein RimM|nr:ribosome maturation factor RimM [Candidatus Dormibacteraeota bacterium]